MKTRGKQPNIRNAIRSARNMIRDVLEASANEAETRARLRRIFVSVLGYDEFKHLSREKSVHGIGQTDHVDFAIKLNNEFQFFVELKSVGKKLTETHLKQAQKYAVDSGVNWVLLTNLLDWHLYHIEFGQPPVTVRVLRFNFMDDDMDQVVKSIDVLSKKAVTRGSLDALWQRTKAVKHENLLRAVISEQSLRAIRSSLRRDINIKVSSEDLIMGISKMLNEKASAILEQVRQRLSEKHPPKRAKAKPAQKAGAKPAQETEGVRAEDANESTSE